MSAPGPGRRRQERAADRARELLSCLVGVAHAEVTPDGRGGILGVRVWGTGEFTPERTVRSVQSALRAHLDLSLNQERIRFVGDPAPPNEGHSPGVVVAAPGSNGGAHGAEARPPAARVLTRPPPSRIDVDSPASRSEPSPNGAGTHGAGAGGTGTDRASAPSNGAAEPSTEAPTAPETAAAQVIEPSQVPARDSALRAPEPGLQDRILYEGFQVLTHRTRQTQLRVKLEWRDRQFIGLARGTDDPREQAEALARATLKALEGIVHTAVPRATFSLELAGIEFPEIAQYRLVVVVIKLKLGREVLPLSGSVVARSGPGLAAILAVLQAADRRIRAIVAEREPSTGIA